MNAEDLLPFDPAKVPWKTSPSEWALCLVPDPMDRVWIEHRLIRAMLVADYLDPDSFANVHAVFTTIGGKLAAVLNCPVHDLQPNKVIEVKFTNNPVIMRAGRFGDDMFVFLSKPELEDG